MYKTKRITSFLLVFVMVFSIFAGTISMAAEDNTKTKLNVSINLDEKDVEFDDYGLKVVKGTIKEDLTNGKIVDRDVDYTIESSNESYKLEKVEIFKDGNTTTATDFKIRPDSAEMNIKIYLKSANKVKVNLSAKVDGVDYNFEQLGLKFGEPPLGKDDKFIYLKKNETHSFIVGEPFKLVKINDKENTTQEIKVDDKELTVKLEFEHVTGKVDFKANLTAPSDVLSKVKIKFNGTEYTKGTPLRVDRGSKSLEFTGVPTGHTLVLKNKDGSLTDIGSKYNFSVDENTVLEFGVKNNEFKILLDAPKINDNHRGLKEFNIYTTPSTNVILKLVDTENSNKIYETITVKTDVNGKGVVKFKTTDALLSGMTVKATAENSNLVTASEAKINSNIKELELKVDEINVGENKITGTSNGAKVKAYIYNTTSKKFTELTETNITNGKFEINIKDGVKLGDEIYIKAMNDSTEGVYKLVKTASAVKRLSGKTKFLTAVAIAEDSYPKADNVIIANGDVSADALSAGPLANELNAPILLVKSNYASQEVINYIKDAGVKNIYVVGGEGSVNNSVVNSLKPVTTTKVERIKGSDRYETSLEIAKKLVDKHGYGANNTVLIANGTDAKSADALSASTYATQKKEAIVLSSNSGLTSKVKTGLTSLNITKADIVGGASSVADSVLSSANLTKVTRISGVDRYATSLAVAEKLTGVKTVVITNGYKSADALTAASLGKTKSAAIILTDGNNLTSTQDKYIADLGKLGTIYIAGGSSSVTTAMEKTLAKFIK